MGDVRLTQDRAAVCSLWHLSVTQVMQHMQTPGKHLHRAGVCKTPWLAPVCDAGDATHADAWQTPAQVFKKHPGRHLSVTQVMQTPGSPGNAGKQAAWRSPGSDAVWCGARFTWLGQVAVQQSLPGSPACLTQSAALPSLATAWHRSPGCLMRKSIRDC